MELVEIEFPIVRPGEFYEPPEDTVRFTSLKPFPSKAWIFGKGPSFEQVPWETIGHPRIGINDSAMKVPDCDYMFALDDWTPWVEPHFKGFILSPCQRVIAGKQWHCPQEYRPRWSPFKLVKLVYWEKIKWYRREYYLHSQVLYKAGITLPSAFVWAWAMGANTIETWGVDGGFRYGRKWKTNEHEKGFSKYDDCNRFLAEDLCPTLGIEWIKQPVS